MKISRTVRGVLERFPEFTRQRRTDLAEHYLPDTLTSILVVVATGVFVGLVSG